MHAVSNFLGLTGSNTFWYLFRSGVGGHTAVVLGLVANIVHHHKITPRKHHGKSA